MASPQSEQNAGSPSERPESQKSVFVIIPSGGSFDNVYTRLIKDPLETAGFRVTRAQDLSSARSILKDIIQGIENSDIIVADLTGLNPNVFYEVGLAHALRRPVILLTQDIKTLPFDLQQYRAIPYLNEVVEGDRLAEELPRRASDIMADSSLASGPFSDFGMPQHEEASPESAPEPSDEADDTDDMGILDYEERIEEAILGAVPIVEAVGSIMRSLNDRVNRLNDDIEHSKTSGGQVNSRRLRKVLREVARDFDEEASRLREQRLQYEARVTPVEDNLERLLEQLLEVKGRNPDSMLEYLATLKDTRQSAEHIRLVCTRLANTISEVPPMERHTNRSLRTLHGEIVGLADMFASTVRFFDRGIAVIERRTQDGTAD